MGIFVVYLEHGQIIGLLIGIFLMLVGREIPQCGVLICYSVDI